MKLYEFISKHEYEEINTFDWEKYQNGEENLITGEEDDYLKHSIVEKVWELISEYCDDNPNITEDDASLIVRLLNDIIRLMSNPIVKEYGFDYPLYARCYHFVNGRMAGNVLLEQCRFIVNNTISYDAFESNREISISDILNCDPYWDIWEAM